MKGKKLFMALVLGLFVCAAPAYAYGPALTNAPDYVQNNETGIPLTVHVDGKYVATDVSPYISNSRTYLPLRAIAEAMGASVSWNQSTKTATISKSGTTISCTIGSTAFTVNGQTQYGDAAPQITNSRTMLPIRAIAEALGGTVSWDGTTASVSIDTAAADAAAPSLPSDIPSDIRWLVEKYYVPADDQGNGSWRCTFSDVFNDTQNYLFVSEMGDGSKTAVMVHRYANDGVVGGVGMEFLEVSETTNGLELTQRYAYKYWHGSGIGDYVGYNLITAQYTGNDLLFTGYWFKSIPNFYLQFEDEWTSLNRLYTAF